MENKRPFNIFKVNLFYLYFTARVLSGMTILILLHIARSVSI